MQGLTLITQMAQTFLNAFGLMSMLQAFVGAVLFIAIVGFVWDKVTANN